MQAARFHVDMRNPQAFPTALSVGQATSEIAARSGQAVELEREFGTLIPHGAKVRGKPGSAQRNRVRTGSKSDRFLGLGALAG
jgi:hypothetical protein